MKFRWTRRKLEEFTDKEILRSLIAERLYSLNPYGLLGNRLNQIYQNLDMEINNERRGKNK